MDRFGSDKPDTRFGMELHGCDRGCQETVNLLCLKARLENGGTVRGINAKGQGGNAEKEDR